MQNEKNIYIRVTQLDLVKKFALFFILTFSKTLIGSMVGFVTYAPQRMTFVLLISLWMSSAGTTHPTHCCEHAHYVTKGCLDHFISGPYTKKITTTTRRQNTVKLVSWPCVLRSNAITVQYNTHRDYKDNKTHERM